MAEEARRMRWPSPGLLLITVGSVLVFVALAATGWGTLSGLLAHPLRRWGLIVITGAAVVSLFSGIHLGGCVRPDARERWRLLPLAALSLLIAVVPPWCDRHDWVTGSDGAVRWVGLGLLAVGALFRVGPMFVLGERFTWPLAGQVSIPLQTRGFYRWIRHPSYAGALVGGIGWSLLFRSGVGLVLVTLLIPCFFPVVQAEEEQLGREYGEAYTAYRRLTWRLIPGIF